jgi:glutathione synthase/RimK-type ligase-like ATP-grasp enzyme
VPAARPTSAWLACHRRWPSGHPEHHGLIEAFAESGVDAAWAVWDDPGVDWSARDLVVIRETWDYPEALGPFLDWVDRVGADGRLVNPAALVRWNHHKGYLLELADDGVATVPTVLVAAGLGAPGLPEWPELVVKPAVGVGGDGAGRVGAGSAELATQLAELGRRGDLLVQPYLASIEDEGETSLVMVAGRVTHAVAKVPAAGEFRIHEHHGGTYRRVDPTRSQLDLATGALAAAEARTGCRAAYARADVVPGPDGVPLLMELELIEPSLYFHHAPDAAATFVAGLSGARW